jgi:hypothetical protein
MAKQLPMSCYIVPEVTTKSMLFRQLASFVGYSNVRRCRIWRYRWNFHGVPYQLKVLICGPEDLHDTCFHRLPFRWLRIPEVNVLCSTSRAISYQLRSMGRCASIDTSCECNVCVTSRWCALAMLSVVPGCMWHLVYNEYVAWPSLLFNVIFELVVPFAACLKKCG